MRRLLIPVIVMAALLSVVTLAARSLGKALDPEPLYLDTGACSQPCWHGVRVGTTTADEAQRLLQADRHVYDLAHNDPNPIFHCIYEWKMQTIPYYTGCMIIAPDQPVKAIELRPSDRELQLAAMIAQFGQPIAAQLCRRLDFGPHYRLAVFAVVYFPDNVTVIAYDGRPDAWWLSPQMFVKLIRYDQPAAEPPIPFNAPRWKGFASSAVYGRVC